MEKNRIEDYTGGWIIGNFLPVIQKSEELEIGIKFFRKNDIEPSHMQRTATEITVLHSGKARIGDVILIPGDILIIPPLESADFEALEDGSLTCIKFPSLPDDKVLL
jgi:hypothetical protein